MVRTSLLTFFTNMEKAYHAGDFEKVADCFVLPGGVYLGLDVIVLSDRPKLLSLLRDQCRRNHRMGVRYVRPRVTCQSLRRRNNYSVWVSWDHYGSGGELMSILNTRYICRDNAAGLPMIQLVECPDMPRCYSTHDMQFITERGSVCL